MNKAEIINGLEDLVRSTKSSLDYSPSDDVFLRDIAVLNAAIAVIIKHAAQSPFLDIETLNLYQNLMRISMKGYKERKQMTLANSMKHTKPKETHAS